MVPRILLLVLFWSMSWLDAQVDPAGAGMDPDRLLALRTRLQEFVEAREIAGAVTLVARRGRIASWEAVGYQDLERGIRMQKDSIFRIASMTKPVTALAVLLLKERGQLSLDDPVEEHLLEFRDLWVIQSRSEDQWVLRHAGRPITLRHLLTHTSGMAGGPPPGLSDLYSRRNRTLAEAVVAFSQRPLEFEPGTRWSYSNTGIDTLGRIIEVVSGRPYAQFLQEELFDPLEMTDTFFFPPPEKVERIARLYQKGDDGLVPAESFLGEGIDALYPLPAGGLYSTAGDLSRLYQMMLRRGVHEGQRILQESSVTEMTRLQTGDLETGFVPGMGFGLGWGVVREPRGVTAMLSPGSFGHGGAFGTQGWIDPQQEICFILLIQRTGFGNADGSQLRRVFQSLATAAIIR